MPDAGVIAVVFAGGTGSRMRSAQQPKQFVQVEGKPILVHTLERFQAHPDVDAVYVSCVESHIDDARRLVRAWDLDKVRRIVPGGASAQESIYNGMRSACSDGLPDDTVVLVHDGVRPLINQDLISRNIHAARVHGSAVTAIPCFETIARSVDAATTIDAVTAREQMHVLQAPQTFTLGRAHRANLRSEQEGLLGTFVDQAQLMRHYGEQLHMVLGLRGNVKLTTDLDLLQFQLLAGSGRMDQVVGEG